MNQQKLLKQINLKGTEKQIAYAKALLEKNYFHNAFKQEDETGDNGQYDTSDFANALINDKVTYETLIHSAFGNINNIHEATIWAMAVIDGDAGHVIGRALGNFEEQKIELSKEDGIRGMELIVKYTKREDMKKQLEAMKNQK